MPLAEHSRVFIFFIFVVVAPVAPGLITAGVHADFNDYGLVSWTWTYSARNHRCAWGIFSSDSVQMKAINCYNNTWIDTLLQYGAAAQFHRISSTHVCSSYATQFFTKRHLQLQCLRLVMSDQADYNVNHYKRQGHSVWRLSCFSVWGLWHFMLYEVMVFHVVRGSWYFTVYDEGYGVSPCTKMIIFHSVWGIWHFMLYEDHGISQCVTRVMVFHSVWRLLYFTVYEDYGISCCMMIIVFHSEWRLSYFTVYVEGYGFHSVWGSSYFTVYDQGCGISQWMKIIVFYSVCGGLWFSQCMRIVVFHSVWPGLWYFTVYEDYRILQRMRRIMVFHSVWGLWYVTVYEDYSISNCEGYGISQCTRIMVFHVVWGSLYFTVYEEGYGISQSMRIMAFHSVWRLQSLQYCADTKVQLETVTVFHFETPQQRHNQIVLIAINWKCQRNIRNIIAFPAAWLSTTAW